MWISLCFAALFYFPILFIITSLPISACSKVFSFEDNPFDRAKFLSILNTSFIGVVIVVVRVVVGNNCTLLCMVKADRVCENVYQCVQSDLYSDSGLVLLLFPLFLGSISFLRSIRFVVECILQLSRRISSDWVCVCVWTCSLVTFLHFLFAADVQVDLVCALLLLLCCVYFFFLFILFSVFSFDGPSFLFSLMITCL